jgi:hypothetical protein
MPEAPLSYHAPGAAMNPGTTAESWYRQSLQINEALGDRPSLASSYGQLGLLAEARGDPAKALDWMVRCSGVFPEFPHPATGPGPHHLARLTGRLACPPLRQAGSTAPGTALRHISAPLCRTLRPWGGSSSSHGCRNGPGPWWLSRFAATCIRHLRGYVRQSASMVK